MIPRADLTPIGRFIKPHGIKGELSAAIEYDGVEPADLRCVFVYVDGLAVPFFIESARWRGTQGVLLTLEGVADENQARFFAGREIFAQNSELPEDDGDDDEDGMYLSDLEGYTVISDGTALGTVAGFDDSTANVLLMVDTPGGNRLLIPAADEFFISIDPESKTIEMSLPAGLTDLNQP